MQKTPAQAMGKECPKHYKLGKTKTEIHIDSADENKNAAICLAKQARYSIDIFTQDLDAEIYNNKDFEHAILKLVKRHPSTSVRILLQDSRKSVQNGHRLIRLAQTLTSYVFIHKPSPDHKDEQCAFMVVDHLGFMNRPIASNKNYKAGVNFMSPRRAGELLNFFNEVWEHSTSDSQTRRIYL